MCVHPKSYKKLALQVGALFAGLAAICFVWPWIRGMDAGLSALHYQLWKMAFFGYTGFNLVSFIAAVAQSFIWGMIAVGVWRLAGVCCDGKGSADASVSGTGDHCGNCK